MGFVHFITSDFPSRFQKGLISLGFFIFLFLGTAASTMAEIQEVSLLQSDNNQVVFEVKTMSFRFIRSTVLEGTEKLVIQGFNISPEPGEPNVPSRKYLVAIPPDVEYSVRWTVLKAEPLGRHRLEPVPFPYLTVDESGEPFMSERYVIEDSIYSRYQQKPPAEGKEAAYIRHQRVLPIFINPVSYDPETGETSIAGLIRVMISFTRSTGGRPGSDVGRELKPRKESPVWERILSRLLINPEQAAKWRIERRFEEKMSPGARPSRSLISGPLVKLRVRETGLHRVTAASVVAAGFPANEPISNLHLFKRGYSRSLPQEEIMDIPFSIYEDPGGIDGIFEGSDVVVFYGLRLRDDVLQQDPVEKFADFNGYWLGTSGGPSMMIQPLHRGFISADTADASFEVVDRYEEDHHFIEDTPPNYGSFYEAPIRIDFYGFSSQNVSSLSVPFTVHAMKPGATLQIQAEFLGAPQGTANLEVDLSIENSLGGAILNSAHVPWDLRILYSSQPVLSENIEEGENQLLITESQGRGVLKVFLMWVKVTYPSLYRAKGNILSFNTASLLGDTSITVTGLTRKDLLLFDVTDPYQSSQFIVADSLFTDVGGGYAFSFRETFTAQRRYVLTPLDGIAEIPPEDVVPGASNTLIGNPLESGVDVLVVCYGDFLNEMQQWVDYRRTQGYKVLMADAEDVYDEFNSGVPNPMAIKNFIRHFFERANASFVVLVGDASEDNKNIHSDSAPNFIPTESFPEYAGGSFDLNEVVTSDKWYVLMGNDYFPGQNDFYPDLIIGRIPAGSENELEILLDKIFVYERPGGSDFWRRRMLLVADDAWSFSTFGTCNLNHHYSEEGFEAGSEECAQTIESSPASEFDVVRFYCSDILDPIHPPIGQCMNSTIAVTTMRSEGTPMFLSELNTGGTLVSIQAHMNRHQICHELLFTTVRGKYSDHLKLTNDSRPFIAFGFGCHFSDYALFRESSAVNIGFNWPTGDCVAELLMISAIRRGSVATYGSSGFEYLTPNRILANDIFGTFFSTPPADTMVGSNRAQVRWIFGEIMTLSEIAYSAEGPIKRYHILGDPLLWIDAGPPRFEVTVNGVSAQSGDFVTGGAGSDTVHVEAVISDEVGIDKLTLEINNEDVTPSMTVTPLIDTTLSASRKYRVRFSHKLLPERYDIVIRVYQYQAPDTTSNTYHMEAEFILRVQSYVTLRVNGREVKSGDHVPPEADYLLELGFPVMVDQSSIEVEIDGTPLQGLVFDHPSPADSTTWLVSFSMELSEGLHTLKVFVDESMRAEIDIYVSTTFGLKQVINYPNPFRDDTYFVYTNEVEITRGTIDVFTTSGKKIAHLDIPPNARQPGQNAVYWDGRDFARDEIANGVYIYIVTVEQRGKRSTVQGKMARVE